MELVENDNNGLYEGIRIQQSVAKFFGPWLQDAAVMKDGYAAYEPIRIK